MRRYHLLQLAYSLENGTWYLSPPQQVATEGVKYKDTHQECYQLIMGNLFTADCNFSHSAFPCVLPAVVPSVYFLIDTCDIPVIP